MSRAKWDHYQERLRKLGLAGAVMKAEGQVEFRVEAGSIPNGDSYRGYEFSLTPPETVLSTLDNYRTSEADRKLDGWQVCKRIKGNWYLYLFVSR